MRRPAVGVTGYLVNHDDAVGMGFGPRDLAVYAAPYFNWLIDSGLLPVPLYPGADADDYLDVVDSIVLSGGSDVDPSLYGGLPHEELGDVVRERDEFELGLTKAALAAGVPVLGICRGMQLVNIARGGTLHQHLPDLPDSVVHASEWATPGRRTPGTRWVPQRHEVTVTEPDLAALTGERLVTNSYHHQAIDRLGDGLVAAARTDDGIIEAVVGTDQPVLGVQWHPEMHTADEPAGRAPFRWLAAQTSAAA